MIKCFACDRPLTTTPAALALTIDGQAVHVGPDCFAAVAATTTTGYPPPLGGPRLFAPRCAPASARLRSNGQRWVMGGYVVNARTGAAVPVSESVWWRTLVARVGAQYDDPESWYWL